MRKNLLTEELDKDFHYYLENNCDFDLVLGRFSAEIRIDGQRFFYTKGKRHPRIFAILKKIKSELRTKLHLFDVPKENLNYFFINYNHPEGMLKNKTVCNIDIKSAYLTALIRKNVLSEKICSELRELPKEDRLVIIGMLAFQPTIYHYEEGNLIGFSKKENPYRNVFFYCVSEIEKIMKAIVDSMGEFLIGTWVDGVYFVHDKSLELQCIDYLKFKGYDSSVDFLTEFSFIEDEYEVSLNFKNGKGKEKKITYPSKSRTIQKINAEIKEKIYGKKPLSDKEFDSYVENL